MKMTVCIRFMWVLWAILACGPVLSQVYLHGSSGSNSGSCGSKGSPCQSIQYAIDNIASSGDTLYLTDTFSLPSSASGNQYIAVIPEGWTLAFVGQGNAVIDGKNKHKGISHDYRSPCNFANGSGNGGTATADIYVRGINFVECTAKDGSANCGPSIRSYGGAIYVQRSINGNIDVEIQNCNFIKNSAQVNGNGSGGDLCLGGAVSIYGRNNGRAVINNCYFSGNYSTYYYNGAQGGAVSINTIGYAEITNCAFCNNYVEGLGADNGDLQRKRNAGAAIGYLDLRTTSTGNNMLIDGCIFMENEAKVSGTFTNESGEAVFLNSGDASSSTTAVLNIENSTFYKNINEQGAAHFGTRGGTLNTTNVVVSNDLKLVDNIPTVVCQGDSIEARYLPNATYWWNGKLGRKTRIDKSGQYIVEVSFGSCGYFSDTVNITILGDALDILDSNACAGDTVFHTTSFNDTGALFYWKLGTGQLDTGQIVSGYYPAKGKYATTLIVDFNGKNCTDSITDSIEIFAKPQGNFQLDSICVNDSLHLYSQSSNALAGQGYQWKVGGVTVSIDSSHYHRFSNPGLYEVSLVLTNGNCQVNLNDSTLIYSVPTLSVFGDTSLCEGDTAWIGARGNGRGYTWSNNSSDSNLMVWPLKTTIYSVKTQPTANGCRASDSVAVVVFPKPNITISGPDSVCTSDTILFAAMGGAQYVWNTGQTGDSITFQLAGDTLISAYSISAHGCRSNSDSQNVYLRTVGTLVLTGDTQVCAGQTASFSAKKAVVYDWNVSTSKAASIGLSYSPDKDSSVIVIVRGLDSQGCRLVGDSLTLEVESPQLYVQGDTSICQGDSIQLTARGVSAYVWNTSTTDSDLVVVPSKTSFYSVIGTSLSGCSIADSVLVEVGSLPIFSIHGPDSVCLQDSAVITGSGGARYFWSTGDTTDTFLMAVSTDTAFSGYAIDSSGCKSQPDTHAIYLHLSAQLQVTGDTMVCTGQSGTFYASNGLSYVWNRSSSGSDTMNLVFTSTKDSSTWVVVSGQGKNGCKARSDSLKVDIRAPQITVFGDTAICHLDSTRIGVSGGTQYAWSTNTTDSVLFVKPLKTTTYVVSAKDGYGCAVNDSVTVQVWSQPSFAIQAPDSVCSRSSVWVKGTGGGLLFWNTGYNTDSFSLQVHTDTLITGYKVDTNGCQSKVDSHRLWLRPGGKIVLQGDQHICSGDAATFVAESAVTYSWNISPQSDSSVSVTYTTAFDSMVEVIVFGKNSFGCSLESDSITLQITRPPTPNIIGPDQACLDDTVTFSTNAKGAITIVWSLGGIGSSVTTVLDGTTTVQVYTLKNGCRSKNMSKTVYADRPPGISFVAPDTVCKNSQIQVQGRFADHYEWRNGQMSEALDSIIDSTSWFVARGYTALNCVGEWDSILVHVVDSPRVSINFSDTSCLGDSVFVEALSNYQHNWSGRGDGADVHSWRLDRDSHLYVVPFNAGCWGDTAFASVMSRRTQTINILAPDSICPEDSLLMAAENAEYVEWSTGDTTSGLLLPPINDSTTFNVRGIDLYGCEMTPDTHSVYHFAGYRASFDLRTNGVENSLVRLTSTSQKAGRFFWELDDSVRIDSTGSIFHVFGDTNLHQMRLVIESVNGCRDTSEWKKVKLRVKPVNPWEPGGTTVDTLREGEGTWTFVIPNAFTPNGDGLNDNFKITGPYTKLHGMIFNRWGEKIYEWDGDNWWSGTFKQKDCPLGKYLYVLEYTPKGETEKRTESGIVVLLR